MEYPVKDWGTPAQKVTPQNEAVRQAFRKAIEPLLKLESKLAGMPSPTTRAAVELKAPRFPNLGFPKTAPALDMANLPQKTIFEHLSTQVRHDAAEQWPDAKVDEKDGAIRVLYHMHEQDVERPAGKSGGGMVSRLELGPDPDGFGLYIRLTDQVGAAVRPQTMESPPWRTFLGQLDLGRKDFHLEVDVSYGHNIDGRRLDQFLAPARWLIADKSSATEPATAPAAAN